jgi:TusA-related sulfurtransferase
MERALTSDRLPWAGVSTVSGAPVQCRPHTGDDDMQVDRELDARGLNCPLPILKAKKALAEMSSGQVLKVIATDAGSVRDFQAFAKQTGNELLQQDVTGPDYISILRRR